MSALRELLATFDIAVNTTALRTANAGVTATASALEKVESGAHSAGGEVSKVGGLIARMSAGAQKALAPLAQLLSDNLGKALAIVGAGGFAKGLISDGKEIATTAARIGMSVRETQKWSYITGQDLEELAVTARFLQDNLAGAAAGVGASAKAFATLGIKAKDASGKTRTMGDVIPELAEKFGEIKDPAQQTALVLDVFGRRGIAMLPMLKKGRKGVEELAQAFELHGGGWGEAGVEGAKKISRALKDMKFQVFSLRGRIADSLLPTLATWWTYIAKGSAALLQLTERTSVFQSVAIVAGAFVAKAFLPMIAAWAGPILVAGALLIVLEDIVTLCRGGKSTIGEMLDSFGGAGTAKDFVEGLNTALQATVGLVKFVVDTLSTLPKFLTKELPEAWDFATGKTKVATPDSLKAKPSGGGMYAQQETERAAAAVGASYGRTTTYTDKQGNVLSSRSTDTRRAGDVPSYLESVGERLVAKPREATGEQRPKELGPSMGMPAYVPAPLLPTERLGTAPALPPQVTQTTNVHIQALDNRDLTRRVKAVVIEAQNEANRAAMAAVPRS